MFYHLLLIHLYRPFLKYTKSNSPLPQHVSPRRLCTQAASAISKLLRMYKRTYGFCQICNIAVYIAHTACTIHLLNLPEKNAQRDIIHGLRNLEEMGDSWLCARRTLRILDISANKWQVQLPQEASSIFERSHTKWGSWGSWDQPATSPSSTSGESPPAATPQHAPAVQNRMSTSDMHPPAVPQSNPPNQVPTGLVTPMDPQYQPGNSTQPSISAMRAARRSVSVQLQKPDNNLLPEPTYLRPISHFYHSVQAVRFSQHDAWYGPSEQRMHAMDAEPTSPSTNASTLTSFEGPTNLVEESQDWWSRNPSAALGFGMGNWDEGWGAGIADAAAAPPPTTTLQSSGTTGEPASQPLEFPVTVPGPNMSGTGQDPNTLVYNSMGFPPNFQA